MTLVTHFDSKHMWLTIGFLGQIMFSMRFLVQWLASEKRRESIIPVAFWYFSIAGGLLLFLYSLWRVDPVFILGQSMGLFIYSRNLYLIHRQRLSKLRAVPDGAPTLAQQ